MSKKSISFYFYLLILALYLGGFLNLPVYIARFLSDGELFLLFPNWITILIELILCVAFSYFFLLLLSIISIYKVIFKILTSFIFIGSCVASYYMFAFKVSIGYGVIISLMTTKDQDLFWEMINLRAVICILVLVMIALFIIWYPKIKLTATSKLTHLFISFFILIFIGLMVYFPLKLMDKSQKQQASLYNIDLPSYSGILAGSYLPINWLNGLGRYIYTSLGNSENYENLMNPAEKYHYEETENLEDTFVIFILGETTRGDHMQLLGYERETNPLLSQEDNLIAFQGRSCDTATKLSMRCMFVREGGVKDNVERTVTEKNIFSVLKSLGFTSELYSMQGEVWFYSAIDLNDYEDREMIIADQKNIGKRVDDFLLVEKLRGSIKEYHKGKHLIILHTKGSHYLYSMRYPDEFEIYKPTCKLSGESCNKEMQINAFDNSIIYMDYVIKSIIDEMRDKKAIIFYASDHGESIEEDRTLHATDRRVAPPEQFDIPIMIWMSDSFLDSGNNRERFNQLKKNKQDNRILKHSELFDSMLDCLGYQSKDGGINIKNSWCAD